MKPEILTIYNPVALDNPDIQTVLKSWSENQNWFSELAKRMYTGAAVVIVGTTDPLELEAASVVTLPSSMSETDPWVVHFHNNGPRGLTKAMIKAVVDFVHGAGYTAFKALNQSGHTDKVWLRAFRSAGKPVHLGSAYLFDLDKGSSNGSDPIRSLSGSQPVRQGRRAKSAKHNDARGHDAARVSTARADSGRRARKLHRGRPRSRAAV